MPRRTLLQEHLGEHVCVINQRDLLDTVFELTPTANPRAALALGVSKRSWLWKRGLRTPRMLSSQTDLEPDCRSRRVRCRSRVATTCMTSRSPHRLDRNDQFGGAGWRSPAAAAIMSEAFIALSKRYDRNGYSAGKTSDAIQGEPESLRIVADLEPFAAEPGSGISVTANSPSPALIRQFVLEKRGSFQLALKDFAAAVGSYAPAEAAENLAVGSSLMLAGSRPVPHRERGRGSERGRCRTRRDRFSRITSDGDQPTRRCCHCSLQRHASRWR